MTKPANNGDISLRFNQRTALKACERHYCCKHTHLQAIRIKREKEEQRRGWEEMAATDEDLLAKFQNRQKCSDKIVVGSSSSCDHDRQLPFSMQETPDRNDDHAPFLLRGASRRLPSPAPEPLVSQVAIKEVQLLHDGIQGKGIPPYKGDANGGLGEKKQKRLLQEEVKEEGNGGQGEGKEASCSPQITTAPASGVSSDDSVATPPPLVPGLCSRTQRPGTQQTSDAVRNKRKDQIITAAFNGGNDGKASIGRVAECKDKAENGGGENLSDASWSSFEESDELVMCEGSNNRRSIFTEVDDWEGTAPYGSDDDGGGAPTTASLSSSKNAKGKGSMDFAAPINTCFSSAERGNRRVVESVANEGLVRKKNSMSHGRTAAVSFAEKLGRSKDSHSNNADNQSYSSGKNMAGVREGRVQLAHRQRAAKNDEDAAHPQVPELPRVPSKPRSSFPSSSSPLPLVAFAGDHNFNTQQVDIKTKMKTVGLMKQKHISTRNTRRSNCDDPPLDCCGRPKALFPGGRGEHKNKNKAEHKEGRKNKVYEGGKSKMDMIGGCDDGWVLREFQARVEAARREEGERMAATAAAKDHIGGTSGAGAGKLWEKLSRGKVTADIVALPMGHPHRTTGR